jgi:hypothetical protein
VQLRSEQFHSYWENTDGLNPSVIPSIFNTMNNVREKITISMLSGIYRQIYSIDVSVGILQFQCSLKYYRQINGCILLTDGLIPSVIAI